MKEEFKCTNEDVFRKDILEQDSLLFNEDLLDIQKTFDKISEKKLNLEYNVELYQKNNDSSAFNKLYFHFKPHFERIAFQRKDEDLIQELSEVLWNATLKYNLCAGVKFKTFFWTCVHNHIGTKKIRQSAKKRGGSTVVHIKTYDEITGEEFYVEEKIQAKNISLNTTVMNENGNETELSSIIESEKTKNDYKKTEFYICLEKVLESGMLKENEIKAIKMHIDGYSLNEIGQCLNGRTASAIHSMLRKLGDKEIIKKYLLNVLD